MVQKLNKEELDLQVGGYHLQNNIYSMVKKQDNTFHHLQRHIPKEVKIVIIPRYITVHVQKIINKKEELLQGRHDQMETVIVTTPQYTNVRAMVSVNQKE